MFEMTPLVLLLLFGNTALTVLLLKQVLFFYLNKRRKNKFIGDINLILQQRSENKNSA